MIKLQRTIDRPVTLSGYGVHSAVASTLTISPAKPNTGIIFRCQDVVLQANYKNVYKSNFCTALYDASGQSPLRLNTIEHLMAAIAGLSIDNLLIEVSAPELPILDGSARPYVQEFAKAALVEQVPRKYFIVREAVRVESSFGFAEFEPYDGTIFDVTIEFPSSAIGRQRAVYDVEQDNFAIQIASARTFGFVKDIENLWASGLALGSSLENSLVIDTQDKIVNAEGLRYKDEFVRHKLLDAIGDTALLGQKFKGIFRSFCSGHSLNLKAVEKLVEMSKIA